MDYVQSSIDSFVIDFPLSRPSFIGDFPTAHLVPQGLLPLQSLPWDNVNVGYPVH
jgi:hypothetical protein